MKGFIPLDLNYPIWERCYTVSPIVVIGTVEPGGYDLAPKHMAMPMGWGNYFGFMCTPEHATYHNIKRSGEFTVSYIKPESLTELSLSASMREDSGEKSAIDILSTIRAKNINGIFLSGSYLMLECRLHKIIDGFGSNSLISGRVTGAQLDPSYARDPEIDEGVITGNTALPAFFYPDRFVMIDHSLKFPFPAKFKK